MGTAVSAAPSRERRLLLGAIERYAARFPSLFFKSGDADAARVLRELFAEITDAVGAHPS